MDGRKAEMREEERRKRGKEGEDCRSAKQTQR